MKMKLNQAISVITLSTLSRMVSAEWSWITYTSPNCVGFVNGSPSGNGAQGCEEAPHSDIEPFQFNSDGATLQIFFDACYVGGYQTFPGTDLCISIIPGGTPAANYIILAPGQPPVESVIIFNSSDNTPLNYVATGR
jgi:hypothetical protein